MLPAPSWPHHHQNAAPPAHAATKVILSGLQDDASREVVFSRTQHRHLIWQAKSRVFTWRPPKNCSCWSSTTTTPTRKRRQTTPMPPATTKSMQGSHPEFEHNPTTEGSRSPSTTAAANHTSWRPQAINHQQKRRILRGRRTQRQPPHHAKHHADTGGGALPEA